MHASAVNLLVTAALIVHDGRLLITQRPSHKKFGLMWEFPGGKVEPQESFETCLRREIEEELGLTVAVGRLFQRIRHDYDDFCIDLLAYWCRIERGEISLNEHAAYEWVLPAELARFDFTHADRELIRAIEHLPSMPGGGREGQRSESFSPGG